MEEGLERMNELDYRNEGCEMLLVGNGYFTHELTRAMVAFKGTAQDWILQYSVIVEWGAHMALPLPRELWAVDGCCRRSSHFL